MLKELFDSVALQNYRFEKSDQHKTEPKHIIMGFILYFLRVIRNVIKHSLLCAYKNLFTVLFATPRGNCFVDTFNFDYSI